MTPKKQMTKEQSQILSEMHQAEGIMASNYWENFKYHKELSQGVGPHSPKARRIEAECNAIREEWHLLQNQIKNFVVAINSEEENSNNKTENNQNENNNS